MSKITVKSKVKRRYKVRLNQEEFDHILKLLGANRWSDGPNHDLYLDFVNTPKEGA